MKYKIRFISVPPTNQNFVAVLVLLIIMNINNSLYFCTFPRIVCTIHKISVIHSIGWSVSSTCLHHDNTFVTCIFRLITIIISYWVLLVKTHIAFESPLMPECVDVICVVNICKWDYLLNIQKARMNWRPAVLV